MREYIIVSIVSIIVYQLLSILVYKLSKNNNQILYMVSTFVPFILWNYCIWPFVSMFILSWCRSKLNGYEFFYRSGEEILKHEQTIYMTPVMASHFCTDENAPYFIKLSVEGKDIKEVSVLKYMYKELSEFNFFDINVFKNNKE